MDSNPSLTDQPQETAAQWPESDARSVRWGRVVVWAALLALLGIVGVQLTRSQQGPVGPGQKAPDFILTSFDGQEYRLADMAGKIVLINFWASWCKPCEQEAADLQTAWEQYGPSGEVIFLGVDYVDTEPEAMKYLEKFQITYPNGPDLGTRISQAFRTTGVPETYIIDRDGVLRHFKKGPFTSLREIQVILDSLLEDG